MMAWVSCEHFTEICQTKSENLALKFSRTHVEAPLLFGEIG